MNQRNVPGIDAAYLAMDTEEGVEVVWNEVMISQRKNFKPLEVSHSIHIWSEAVEDGCFSHNMTSYFKMLILKFRYASHLIYRGNNSITETHGCL